MFGRSNICTCWTISFSEIPSLVLVQKTGAWMASKETASWLAVGNLCATHKQFTLHTLWELWLKKHTTWPASWPVVVVTKTTSLLLQMAPCWILALWDVKRLWQSCNLGQIAWAICSKFLGAPSHSFGQIVSPWLTLLRPSLPKWMIRSRRCFALLRLSYPPTYFWCSIVKQFGMIPCLR